MARVLDPVDFVGHEDAYSVVDVRDSRFFAAGTAKGAINVPMNPQTGEFGQEGVMTEAQAKEMLASLPKGKPVVVMCYHGYLSQYAAEYLESLGYDAASLAEGYDGYKAAISRL